MTQPSTKRLLTESNASATYVPNSGGRLVGLGDSIPRAGDDLTQVRADSYNLWATVLSGGKLQFVRNAGVGGNTTAQMLARFDTDVTPYQPDVVSVDGGANDFTFGVTNSQFQANIKALVAKIRGINALPILITPGPVSTAGSSQKAQIAVNGAWMVDYGIANNIPVVDMLKVCVDPTTDGNFNTALTGDTGTHPNNAGHYALGKEMLNQLPPRLLPRSTVARYKSDPTNLLANGLFLTNSGGVGNSWNQNWGVDTGTSTFSIISDTNVPGGSAQRFTFSAATGHAQLHQSISTGWSVGDRMRLSGIVSTTGAQVRLDAVFTGPGSFSSVRLSGGDFTRGEMVNDFTVPTGTTAIDVALWAGDRGAGAITGTADFAAITLRNLTTGGLITL